MTMTREALPQTVDGYPITDRILYRGMRINMLAGACGMAWGTMALGMPMTMFMEALGGSGVLMGLAITVTQFSLIMQIPGAFLTDRLSSRKGVWALIALIHRALWFIPSLALVLIPDRPRAVAHTTVWVVAISSLLGQSVSAMWFSWMADLIPERMRGKFWGARQGWVMAASLLALWGSGYLLDVFPPPRGGQPGSWTGFNLIFGVGALLGCLDIIIHLAVPEPKPKLDAESNWFDRLVDPLRNADFRRLTFAMGVFTFAAGLGSLGLVYLKQDYAFSYSYLAALVIVTTLGTLVSSPIWGWVIDRIGGRAFSAAMFLVLPLPATAWFFMKSYSIDFIGLLEHIRGVGPAVTAVTNLLPVAWVAWIRAHDLPQSVWLMFLAGFFAGAFFGGIGICQMNLSGSLAPKVGRTMAMAVFWAMVGLIGSFGSVVAGKVMDYYNAHPIHYVMPTGTNLSAQHLLLIAHALLFWCVCLPLILKIRRGKGEPEFGIAVSQLVLNNPLRSFGAIQTMGAAVTRHRRAMAARALGRRRTALAVSDLIEKLDDPSSEVRQEAALALGSIGSPQAIIALMEKMEDPNSDLAVWSARGLRVAKSPMAVEALLRKLREPDRGLKAACALALGDIGDARAVHPLLEELASSQDVRVLAAIIEAVGRLREVSAVYSLVPVLTGTANKLLSSAVSVSMGDMFGERDEFYRLLGREQREAGSQFPRMARRLRREIRRLTRHASQTIRSAMLDKTNRLKAVNDTGDLDTSAGLLYELGCDFARIRFNLDPAAGIDAFVGEVMGKDERFTAGMWYLHHLKTPWLIDGSDTRSNTDILLGLYFLSRITWE